jgi:putative colanic acid biosynthesis glycosyltransferase
MSESRSGALKIVHINVRFGEGGAAQVMQNIALTQSELGHSTQIAYGYGPGGGVSPHAPEKGQLRLTPKLLAGANIMAFRIFGEELKCIETETHEQLSELLSWADLVHLHVVHSFMLNLDVLIELLIQGGKPIVWTLHDSWIMTGRCAFTNSCRGWERGCGTCPSLKNYPPAYFDNSASTFVKKRQSITRLLEKVPVQFVSCAEWLALDFERAFGIRPQVVHNSVDKATFALGDQRVPDEYKYELIFLCRDLRDPLKVNVHLLNKFADYFGGKFLIVGSNIPDSLSKNATVVKPIEDRNELASLLKTSKRLLFTSKVDTFSLTICEALVLGLEVYAPDSPGIREFEKFDQVNISHDEMAVFEAVTVAAAKNVNPITMSQDDRSYFSPRRMVSDYLTIYSDLLDKVQ